MLIAAAQGRRPDAEVTLVCVGDLMLGAGVTEACARSGNDYPLREVAPLLRDADVTFGNLESPITDVAVRFPRSRVLRAEPAMAHALARAGFDVLSLANNHVIDCQRAGLTQCRGLLTAAGIAYVGAGPTLEDARRGLVITVRGLRVGFLAFSDIHCATFIPDPSRESILMLSAEELRSTVPPLKRRCDALVVSYHWGVEGRREPTGRQRELGRLAIDLGADLVVGHHGHARGEFEQYGGGLIAYCLGNLVFDDLSNRANEGWILTCRLSRAGVVSHEAAPVQVENCQTRLEQ